MAGGEPEEVPRVGAGEEARVATEIDADEVVTGRPEEVSTTEAGGELACWPEEELETKTGDDCLSKEESGTETDDVVACWPEEESETSAGDEEACWPEEESEGEAGRRAGRRT